jgi:hypothetical protein
MEAIAGGEIGASNAITATGMIATRTSRPIKPSSVTLVLLRSAALSGMNGEDDLLGFIDVTSVLRSTV